MYLLYNELQLILWHFILNVCVSVRGTYCLCVIKDDPHLLGDVWPDEGGLMKVNKR